MTQNISQNIYYLGLYDLDTIDHTDKNGENVYKKVEYRKSGNQEYFIMIDQKLKERGNWYKLNDQKVLHAPIIDFCFTNWFKLQTKSVIHNRILLDTEHFISNKWHYYETFKEHSFVPSFLNINNNNIHEIPENFTEKLILKPATGSLSIGIKIVNENDTKEDVIKHMGFYNAYQDWTLSKFHIAKRWKDGCIASNRIYYLIRKFKINNQLHINGYWFDEWIHYKASTKYDENETDYSIIKKQLITNAANNEMTARDFFDKRVLSHEQYLSLFNENEYNIIKQKVTDYLTIISKKISEHLICSNDYLVNLNDDTNENKNMSFHLYGIDSLIMDDLTIKFIEINGAPTITYHAAINCIDYSVMIDEILKLTVDVLYPPINNYNFSNNKMKNDKIGPKYGYFKDSTSKVKLFDRTFVSCGEFTKTLKTPVYVAKNIHNAYPFITNALFNEKRSKNYQRIKNPHSTDIFLFYGMRDRYIHKNSSHYFYDELIEYRISNNGRNAKILNKIQGITYYLASKDRLYMNCKENYYMPNSILFNIDNDNKEQLKIFIDYLKRDGEKRLIIKPVYGSQGKGIIIMPKFSHIDMFVSNMMAIKKHFGYNMFIISVYIDNPKLYTDPLKLKDNIKFNLRFYVLLHINKLATHENNINDINYYILHDVQIYFCVLPYNINISEIPSVLLHILNLNYTDDYIKIYDKIKDFTLNDISNLINLTNLQIVKNLSKYLKINININNFIMSLNDMNYDSEFKNNIMYQAKYIIHDTINSVKHNIRHLNRFVPNSTAFNLIAYDTMLDSDDKLHLIEINRGPDLNGLRLTLGEKKITDIFTEIFDIVIENKAENKLQFFTKHNLDYNNNNNLPNQKS
jgi:glutathione synthase/RimK-type ligase-like ATP-grasp enzyme